jgi:DNA-binding beta-propeller fold protein YncE
MRTIQVTFLLMMMSLSCEEGHIMVGSLFEKRVNIDDGFAVLEDGRVIGAHWSADRVRMVTPEGKTEELARFPKPNGVALIPEEQKVLILSSSSPRMMVYDLQTEKQIIVELDRIYTGIYQSPGGQIFLSSWGNNLIAAYDFERNTAEVLYQGGDFNGPQGMAMNPEGRLLVANFNDGKIFELAPSNPQGITEVFGVPGTTEMRVGDIHWYGEGLLISALEQKQIWYWLPQEDRILTIGRSHNGELDSQDGSQNSAVIDTPNSFFEAGGKIYFSDFREKRIRSLSLADN